MNKQQTARNLIVRNGTFLILVVLTTIAFLGLVQSFLMACFWATILSIVFYRTYRIIRYKLNGRTNLAAFITVVFILLVVILPLFLVTLAMVNESTKLYASIKSGEIDIAASIDQLQAKIPQLERWGSRVGIDLTGLNDSLKGSILSVTQEIANKAFVYASNALNTTVQFFLMLYLLFFFLKDGKQIIEGIVRVVPMGDKRERALLNRTALVARSTLKGTLIVAVIQGSIGGVLFWILGIKGAVLWGVLMTLFSLLPVGGSALIWVPAAIIMIIQGAITKAIIIVIVGALIIGLIDNLLRPLLVGRETKMPDYLVLLATLGGISWFGLTGFIIGPVIAAIFLSCWEMMGMDYGRF